MQTELIEPIGKKIAVFFGGEVGMIYLPQLYGIENTIGDVREEIDWESLTKKYGKWKGWGLHVIFNTESGKPGPGGMFWVDHSGYEFNWDNQVGPHLHVILPNGWEWDIDSRANNCTKPKDKTHRCWVWSGTPPNITAGKNGNTCSAGAGSIQGGDYHGFLKNGVFT